MPYNASRGKTEQNVDLGQFIEQFRKVPWSWFFNDFLPNLGGIFGRTRYHKKSPVPIFPWMNKIEQNKTSAVAPFPVNFGLVMFLIFLLLVFGIN